MILGFWAVMFLVICGGTIIGTLIRAFKDCQYILFGMSLMIMLIFAYGIGVSMGWLL